MHDPSVPDQLPGSRIGNASYMREYQQSPIDLQGKVVQLSNNKLTKEHSKLYRCFRVAEVL